MKTPSWIKKIINFKPTYKFQFLLAAILCYLSILVIISFLIFPRTDVRLKIGDTSGKDFIAPFDIQYINSSKTNVLKQQARDSVPPVLKIDPFLHQQFMQRFNDFILVIQPKIGDVSEIVGPLEQDFFDEISREELLNQLQAANLNESEYNRLMRYSNEKFDNFVTRMSRIHSEILNRQITEENLSTLQESFVGRLINEFSESFFRDIGAKVLNVFTGINTVVDEISTKNARDAIANRVPPVVEKVLKDEIFLREGDIVLNNHIDILNSLYDEATKKKESRKRLKKIITMACLTLAAFIIFWYFLGILPVNPLTDLRNFNLLVINSILMVLLGYAVSRLYPGEELSYVLLVPLVINAWVVTYFISVEASLLSTLFLGVFFSLSFHLGQSYLLTSMMTGAISSFLIYKDCRRFKIIRGSLFLVLIGSLTIIAVNVIFDENLGKIYSFLQHNVAASFIAALLMIGLSMVYVDVFNVITRYHLYDLSDIHHPLIRQLQRNAPGSYHHSLEVGDIGEIAAEAIGANGLLVRVACLYHDIGKSKMPHFYIENQGKGQNPHDRYPPSLSKLVVQSHVKDGVIMARKSRLPREIIDAIQQHQGTTLMAYFFNKALAQSDGKPINEFEYRYDGPKPQYPEMAIIALADSAAGAVKSLEEPTQHRIKAMVDSIFQERLLDGQFDECKMTISKLHAVKESLIETLTGIYHS
ncbi:HDIG domain-containing protein, partial [bacterium]|nr:HDIG domain-containing protein [bacterium]MBU1024872.1 HDIG domain-containing protein [bacterium]